MPRTCPGPGQGLSDPELSGSRRELPDPAQHLREPRLSSATSLPSNATVLATPACSKPLIDLRFFRSIPFSAGVVIALVGMGAAGGYLWVMTFYLQDGRGLTAEHAGLYLVPAALAVTVIAPISGRLAARRGPRLPLAVSGISLAVGAGILIGLTSTTPSWQLVFSFLAFGIGFGMLNAPITSISVAGMPTSQAGVAAAVASAGRTVAILATTRRSLRAAGGFSCEARTRPNSTISQPAANASTPALRPGHRPGATPAAHSGSPAADSRADAGNT